MAQKIQTLFIDDMDGSPAEGTVRFGLDGDDYEIDLNGEHAEDLRASLAKYVTHARKVSSVRNARGARGGRPGPRVETLPLATIREWAKSKGHTVQDRGRVPGHIVDKWREAGSPTVFVAHVPPEPPATPEADATEPVSDAKPPKTRRAKVPKVSEPVFSGGPEAVLSGL